jgi:hypothetical protein
MVPEGEPLVVETGSDVNGIVGTGTVPIGPDVAGSKLTEPSVADGSDVPGVKVIPVGSFTKGAGDLVFIELGALTSVADGSDVTGAKVIPAGTCIKGAGDAVFIGLGASTGKVVAPGTFVTAGPEVAGMIVTGTVFVGADVVAGIPTGPSVGMMLATIGVRDGKTLSDPRISQRLRKRVDRR